MPLSFPEPIARETRPDWKDVPAGIVAQLQNLLGQKILEADIAWGGYSPSACFLATLESRKKGFIKGTHPQQDAHGTRMLRQEVEFYQTLPDIGAFSPGYLGVVGDGREDGWMLAVFDGIDTAPTLPWTMQKITAVFGLLHRLHFRDQKNIPSALPPAHEKNYVEKYLRPAGGWLRLAQDPGVADKALALFEDKDAGRRWLLSALPRFCEWQCKTAAMGGPLGIIHQDLRSDNILFDMSGRVYFIDWPNACYGPVALDIVYFLSTVSAESAFGAEELLRLYHRGAGAQLDRECLSIALASLSGHLIDNAYRAVPAKLPRLRWFQKKTLWSALHWSAALMGVPHPPRFKAV